jgi:hypothetical protein
MPSRRRTKPLPSFSFVTLECKAKEISWFKVHSRAARSHAAYWGGSAKNHRPGQKQIPRQQDSTTAFVSDSDKELNSRDESKLAVGCCAAPAVRLRGSTGPKNAKPVRFPLKAGLQSLRHIEPDHLQFLPPMPSRVSMMAVTNTSNTRVFDFCGKGFVNQFIMFDHIDYSIFFSGCLLLSYAYSMALTGLGTKAALLELKGQLISRIARKMQLSDGLLSPWCLTAIMALGAPIVCLTSQDLPKSLSIWDYIMESMRDDTLCCSTSADIAKFALHEQAVHWQALRRLLFKSSASFHDVKGTALLAYVSNCMEMYVFFISLCDKGIF